MSESEQKWLASLRAMQQAVADFKKLQLEQNIEPYGSWLPVETFEKASDTTSDGDDILDLVFSDIDDDDDSSDALPPILNAGPSHVTAHDAIGPRWLRARLESVFKLKPDTALELVQGEILTALSADATDESLQATLVDLLGFDELELAAELIQNRSKFTSLPKDAPVPNGVVSHLQSRRDREEALRRQDYEHKHAKLAPSVDRGGDQYPHVYRTHAAGNTLSSHGQRYALPIGSERTEDQIYEEYSIPANRVGVLGTEQKLVTVESLDGLCRRTFQGYTTLNRMQSLVYSVAYETSENMLVCAPTGAGKTDAAMLTILNIIAKNIEPSPVDQPEREQFTLHANDFKIVYVAPMKALAAEITEKLGKRLRWLGVQVRELTGDMHLTKAEIIQTQIIVTTPEKWDVVTRKSTGDTELVHKVRLLIIDEVHMLHDERGAVLESLVARTQRQVESSQSLIRIVGLSATLPNFIDVADFLKVNRMAGLFYFDSSFRPVPLEQHFIGVKGKAGSKASRDNLDTVCFQKVRDMLERGHQCMVFVHSRKDTVKAARSLIEKALEDQCLDLFDPSSHPSYDSAVRDMKSSKARELRELLANGLTVHHAGMARSDRNLVERLFSEGVIKVLCCTATLAWGVNLPAAAVVIKGTQIYSAAEGKFIDLGILDVLQIFGRAGRPQFQDTGIGFICTTQDKLQHYLTTVTQQQPIESRFSARLVDNLNAEIALGTVTSVSEAVQWIGYSYLFVRMKQNHRAYGIEWAEFRDDPQLVQRRRNLVIEAARTLQRSQMVIFNETTEELRPKDVGRIASQYYILQSSVEIFNTMMRPQATEADVLKMISMSAEFDNIQHRENEERELIKAKEEYCPCDLEGGVGTSQAKTNILLQSYISRARLEDFALVSDSNYVAQNAARICRALFMIALNRRWGHQCLVLLSLCKSIEKQIWPYEHPFHQFDLPQPVLRNLDDKAPSTSVEALRDMEPAEIGQLVHNHKAGIILAKLLDVFPTLSVDVELSPLNRNVLHIRLFLTPEFNWNVKHHGMSEAFWIWVENSESSEIYHQELFILSKRKLENEHQLDFTIPLEDPLPSQIYVRAVSDTWLGAETVTPVSFQHLIRPDTENVYTDLLPLQPLNILALKNPLLEEIYGQRFEFFNPMQTQLFHCMYYTPANVLLGSPTGSGKTVAAELAMWWAFREQPGSKVVYIAPMKALVKERVLDWGHRLAKPMGLNLVELTGDNTPDTRTINNADIIITTPEKWDGISRSWQSREYVRQVSLVIIDEIHLLAGDRGPVLEIIVSRMNYIASQKENSVRIVGMSTACANAPDLANWLGVKEGLFNFRHSVRPVPLEIYIDGFPDRQGFCPLMQSMNRPTFLSIKSHSPTKPVIVFVASRRQTRLTARDLINFCGMEDNPRRFLHMDEEDLAVNLSRAKDEALREALAFGIGLHHAGLVESDRLLVEELFANTKIQILIATSTLAWGVNLPAHLVVVKGTQFFDAKTEGYKDMDLTDVLQMLGRAGRPQFDSSGIARIFTQDSKKGFYKHFLHTGFPVESSLHKVLDNHLAAEIAAGTIATKQDALDYLTWTFFFRRLHKNPSYYGLEIPFDERTADNAHAAASEYMVQLVDKSFEDLSESGCISSFENGDVDATAMGKIMSYYYLSHKTMRNFLQYGVADMSFDNILALICRATEYDELPVRHNEDLINAELAKELPLNADIMELPMWDPHVKAFLLLQAHFSHTKLPIADYVGDQVSVLDQSIRICQALVDVFTERGDLRGCKLVIELLQCIKSATWPKQGILALLKNADPSLETDPASAPRAQQKPIKNIFGLSKADIERNLAQWGVQRAKTNHIVGVLSRLPNLRLSVTKVNATRMELRIERLTALHTQDGRMYAPRFPKPQSEGFFVLLSTPGNDELIALKRSSWVKKTGKQASIVTKPTTNVTIKLESSLKPRQLRVELLSDGYNGLEWGLDLLDVPAAPSVDASSESVKKANSTS